MSGSFSVRSGSDADSRLSRGPTGARSPTIAELVHPGAKEHPHNETAANWWQTVREQRDTTNPHRSHEVFEIKKRHHTTEIHDTATGNREPTRSHYKASYVGQTAEALGEEPSKIMLYQRDPKGSAVQGDYPHVVTNEAWGPPRGDVTPPSRYASCSLFALDKRRHATPVDGGKKSNQKRVADAFPGGSPTMQSDRSGRESGASTPGGNKNQYRSNFTLQQHKKKHLAEMTSTGLRGNTTAKSSWHGGNETAISGSFHSPTGRGMGCPTPCIPKSKGGTGFSSQKELQYCKRFNTVNLKPRQDLQDGAVSDRPWPKPGDKLVDPGSPTTVATSATPPYPAAPEEDPHYSTAQGRVFNTAALTKYSPKSGVRTSLDSCASDPYLLHSSQMELAERKANCSTHMRHGDHPDARSPRDERPRGSASCSDLALRREPGSKAMNSHKQLEYSKTVHRFAHDDPRRKRPVPTQTPCPVPPTPRSGQWTPAHV